MKLITKKDFIFIICLTAIGFAFALISFFSSAGETAVVRLNGEIVNEINLTDNVYFETEVNGVVVCREDGAVYIKASTCPDKVCERAGRLRKKGQSAVCVPNGVSVEIVGGEKNAPHAVTG